MPLVLIGKSSSDVGWWNLKVEVHRPIIRRSERVILATRLMRFNFRRFDITALHRRQHSALDCSIRHRKHSYNMALKRKRSSPAFSSPCSDSSDRSTNAMPFFYAHSKPVEALHYKPTWSWPTYDDQPSNQYLNSRTRKRHRDNRPDEDQIHG